MFKTLYILIMWANVLSFLRKHRKAILIGVGVVTLGYFALDYLGS